MSMAFFSSCSLKCAPNLKELPGKKLIWSSCNAHLNKTPCTMFPLSRIVFHSASLE